MENNIDIRAEHIGRVQKLQWYDRLISDFVAFLRPRKGVEILCVQCGSGSLAVKLAKRGATVTAVDTLPDLVNITAAAAKRARVRNFHVVSGDPLDLPFSAEGFDLVVAVTLLSGLGEPELAMAEMARVVAVGGAVATLEPTVEVRPERVLSFTGKNSLTGFSFKAFQAWCEEAQAGERFSAIELDRLYQKAGLAVLRSEEQMDRLLLATFGVKKPPKQPR